MPDAAPFEPPADEPPGDAAPPDAGTGDTGLTDDPFLTPGGTPPDDGGYDPVDVGGSEGGDPSIADPPAGGGRQTTTSVTDLLSPEDRKRADSLVSSINESSKKLQDLRKSLTVKELVLDELRGQVVKLDKDIAEYMDRIKWRTDRLGKPEDYWKGAYDAASRQKETMLADIKRKELEASVLKRGIAVCEKDIEAFRAELGAIFFKYITPNSSAAAESIPPQ